MEKEIGGIDGDRECFSIIWGPINISMTIDEIHYSSPL